jgi:hypothetical protein
VGGPQGLPCSQGQAGGHRGKEARKVQKGAAGKRYLKQIYSFLMKKVKQIYSLLLKKVKTNLLFTLEKGKTNLLFSFEKGKTKEVAV